jgi:hypothetical protein
MDSTRSQPFPEEPRQQRADDVRHCQHHQHRYDGDSEYRRRVDGEQHASDGRKTVDERKDTEPRHDDDPLTRRHRRSGMTGQREPGFQAAQHRALRLALSVAVGARNQSRLLVGPFPRIQMLGRVAAGIPARYVPPPSQNRTWRVTPSGSQPESSTVEFSTV